MIGGPTSECTGIRRETKGATQVEGQTHWLGQSLSVVKEPTPSGDGVNRIDKRLALLRDHLLTRRRQTPNPNS